MPVQADANGRVVGSFMIPEGVPTGVKEVRFSGSGGSRARAQYTAIGIREYRDMQRETINTWVRWWGGDPLAQTFMLSESRQITSVDVQFCAIGNPANRVYAHLRTVELGIPTALVLGEGSIDLSGVQITDPLGSARNWTTIPFANPVYLAANQPYALVLTTDDPFHAVTVADLGGFDQVGGWITSHMFPNGTFLSSVDNRTWLPHPASSLTFRLKAAKFNPTVKTMNLGPMSVDQATDLLPMILAERPPGTTIEVEFVTPDGASYVTGPFGNVQLPVSVTGNVTVKVTLRGTQKLSPLLAPTMQVAAGSLQSPGTYISRAIPVSPQGSDPDSRIRVVVDAILPSTSAMQVYAQTDINSGLPVWTEMALEQATQLGDGWAEYQFELSPLADISVTRAKIVMSGGPSARPIARNLRVSVTPVT